MIINTGSHPKALWPGIKKWYGMEYALHDPIWPKMFEVLTSEQSYEEVVEEIGFGLMGVKPQGASISYDTASQGVVSRFTALTYAIGYIVTMEEMQDNLYEKLSFRRAGRLAHSVAETEEIVHANIFNRGFNPAYAGGDGVALFSTAHPTGDGTQSNRLAIDADLSETSIEDMITMINISANSRGLKINNMAQSLFVPAQLMFEANRIMSSVLQNDTSNNAVNVLKATNQLPKGIVSNPYFTDPDAWFIRTNCREGGLEHYTRMAATFDRDNEFDTKNAKAATVARWSQGWSNWRQIYGSAGA
jgi:hypothetical protein